MANLKTKVVLEPGEAYVVLPVEDLRHIAMVYRTLATREENNEAWLRVATLVDEWTDSTQYYDKDEEEWN